VADDFQILGHRVLQIPEPAMSTPALAPDVLADDHVFLGWPLAGLFPFGSVVTMGVFDGFHRGHEALVRRTVGHAKRLHLPAVLVTFTPHPLAVLSPGAAPRQLMAIDDRVRHALSLGIQTVVVLPFTATLAFQSAADFVAEGLVERLDVRQLVVGDNFRCGRGGEGDVARLAVLGETHDFRVDGVDLVDASGQRCSSTEVRRRLACGDVAGARELLGRDDQRVLVAK
jgi:riboflavin kinase/FMN adenylyltransferase